MNADDVSPIELGVMLSSIPVNHPVSIAARLGLEIAEGRRQWRTEHRDISRQISAGADWRAIANNHVTYAELQRRRAIPGPLAGAT